MQAPNPVLNPEHIIKYGTEKKITKKTKNKYHYYNSFFSTSF